LQFCTAQAANVLAPTQEVVAQPVVAAAKPAPRLAPTQRLPPTAKAAPVRKQPVKQSPAEVVSIDLVPKNLVPSNTGFSFGAASLSPAVEDAKDSAASKLAPKILAASSVSETPKEVKVSHLSAWANFGANAATSTASGSVGSPASSKGGNDDDFKKFQRLNAEKKQREEAAQERAEQQRKDIESRRAAQQDRQAAQERDAAAAIERQKQDEEDKRTNALAEAQRLREEAKKKREAMEGHVDLHEQSALFEEFAEGNMFDGEKRSGEVEMEDAP
jgi:hypothetical protein